MLIEDMLWCYYGNVVDVSEVFGMLKKMFYYKLCNLWIFVCGDVVVDGGE